MSVTYGSRDTDVDAWYNNIVANGGSVSDSVRYSVLTFSRNLKSSGLWAKMKEVYILCGVTDLNSALTKLKYIDTQRLINVGFATGDYTATGSSCGIKGDGTYKRLDTSVVYNALPVKDRFAAAYETTRLGNFYDTVIGRERGGGNSAFGPTINPNNAFGSRLLDTTTSAQYGPNSSGDTAQGLIYVGATTSASTAYNNKVWTSNVNIIGDTLGGTGGYVIGGGIGGGGFMKGTLSMGFLGNALTQSQTELLSYYCDIFMTDMGGNK